MNSNICLIYCSEVAAVCNKNPHQKPWKILDALLKRFDQGKTFKKAQEDLIQQKQKKVKLSLPEQLKETCSRLDVAVDVNYWKKEELSTVLQVKKVVEKTTYLLDKESNVIQKAKEKSLSLLEHLEKEKEKISSDLFLLTHNHDINKEKEKEKEKEKILSPYLFSAPLTEKELEKKREKKKKEEEELIKKKRKLEEIEITSKELREEVEQQKTDVITLEQGKREVQSQIQCLYGQQQESIARKELSQKLHKRVSDTNDIFYKMILGQESLYNEKIEWGIGGRIDAEIKKDKRIVEIKNRAYRLFTIIPLYELIQVECYMRLTDKTDCLLVQRLQKNKVNKEESSETLIKRQDILWQKTIVPSLTLFLKGFFKLLENKTWQEEWLVGDDDKKQALYSLILS